MLSLRSPFLFLTVALYGCASPSDVKQAGAFNPYAPVAFVNDRFPRPVAGSFEISTSPALYSEPDFVEAPRRRQAESFSGMYLEKAGLRRVAPGEQPDYRVHYSYSSRPEVNGEGFKHEMDMSITKRGTTDPVWSAKAQIPRASTQDIGNSIIALSSMLTSKFPDVAFRHLSSNE